jgi:hypothetical protein
MIPKYKTILSELALNCHTSDIIGFFDQFQRLEMLSQNQKANSLSVRMGLSPADNSTRKASLSNGVAKLAQLNQA